MKFDIAKLPVIRETEGRPVETLELSDLKESGTVTAFGIYPEDVITFLSKDETVVRRQLVRKGSTAYQYFVSVIRNDNESWLSLGALRRQGVGRTTTCEFCANMIDVNKYRDDAMRMEDLYGKTIKCTGMASLTVNSFDADGTMTGETEERMFPVIEFADEE